MSKPVVSVIIPTYNRAATLGRAIDSVIAQSFHDWELIIVDDGSTDGTYALVERYASQSLGKIRYLHQKNRGASAARNAGIDVATGEFVCFLDSDDEFVPSKLERQLALFEHEPALGLVYSDYSFVDLEGRLFESSFDEKLLLARAVVSTEVAERLHICDGRLFETLLRGYFIATITGMVRRNVLGTSIRFDEQLSYAEEWLFYLQVARATRCGFVDEPLAVHHFTAGSLARSDKAMNARGSCQVLAAILANFPRLRRYQRRIVEGMLGRAYKQVGYDCAAIGDDGEAARQFLRSLRTTPSGGTLRSAVGAILRSVFGSSAKA